MRTLPSALGVDPREHPQVAQEAMLDFVRGAEIVARAMLGPALNQIRLEHSLTIDEFRTLALCSEQAEGQV